MIGEQKNDLNLDLTEIRLIQEEMYVSFFVKVKGMMLGDKNSSGLSTGVDKICGEASIKIEGGNTIIRTIIQNLPNTSSTSGMRLL